MGSPTSSPAGARPAGLDPDRWDAEAAAADAAVGAVLAARRAQAWSAVDEAEALLALEAAYPAVDGYGRELAERAVRQELMAALGCSQLSAGNRMGWAHALGELPALRAAMRAGRVDCARSWTTLEALRGLPTAALRREALARLLAADAAHPGGLSGAQWSRLLGRVVAALDPEGAEGRQRQSRAGRRVEHRPPVVAGGEGGLSLYGPAERVAICHATVEALARAWAAAGVPGTLDQLRFDALEWLITRPAHDAGPTHDADPAHDAGPTHDADPAHDAGPTHDADPAEDVRHDAAQQGDDDANGGRAGSRDVPGAEPAHGKGPDAPAGGAESSADPVATHAADGGVDGGEAGAGDNDPGVADGGCRAASGAEHADGGYSATSGAEHADGGAGPPGGRPLPGCACGGASPGQVLARITVSLATLLGLDEAPGELDGVGAVPASVARRLAAAATVWQRLLTDPADGHLVTQAIKSYRPTSAMRRYVLARANDTCAARGCTARHRLQLDHTRPWPLGATSATELVPLHEPHHDGKTHGRWRHALHPDTGALTQTSPLGRSYTTTPLPPLGGSLLGPPPPAEQAPALHTHRIGWAELHAWATPPWAIDPPRDWDDRNPHLQPEPA